MGKAITYFINKINDNKDTKEKKGGSLMLSHTISEEFIQLNVKAADWEDAIRKSAQPLLSGGKITTEYVEQIIEINRTTGPYIVITKHTALPHAPSQFGAKGKAIGITVLETPVYSGHVANDPVKYLFCLSAPDSNSHLEALSSLVQLLEDCIFFEMLDSATEAKEVLDYIKNKESEGSNYYV